jgi:hypothetical protein
MKYYIVFNMGQDYHDASDAVVRVFDAVQDDPREPDAGVSYKDIPLMDLINKGSSSNG